MKKSERAAWTKKLAGQAVADDDEFWQRGVGGPTAVEAKPKSKYGNNTEARSHDNIKFHSNHERQWYENYLLMEKAGEIRNLRRQVVFQIIIGGVEVRYASGRIMTYKADFTFDDVRSDQHMIVDAKGYKTKEYKIKKALMAAMGKTITEV